MSKVLDYQDVREQLPSLIERAAARVQRRYSEFVELDDLVQEGWLWAATNQKTIDRLLTGVPATGRMMATLLKRMDRTARAHKAIVSGYKPADNHWYSNSAIEVALVWVMNGEDGTFATSERHERVGTLDPSTGNNWPMVLADVRRAWHRANFSPETKAILAYRYGVALTHEGIAELLQLSVDTVSRRVQAGLTQLSDELNLTIDILRNGGCEFEEPERVALPEEEDE